LKKEGGQEPLIVTFFRKLLVADLKLPNYVKLLKELSTEVMSADLLQQVLLSKLRFMFRVGTPRQQQELRPILVQLLRHLLPSSKGQNRSNAITKQLDNLKRESLLLRYVDRD
jgi:hypothetical protein